MRSAISAARSTSATAVEPRQREALRLGHQLAALGDQAVAVPGQIGGRLAEAGGAVELHGEVLRGRHAHEVLAVLPLADRDVRGREVREHGRAGERRQRARRHRRPEVLADVGVEDEAGEMRQDDQHVGAERDPAPEQLDGVRARRGRGLEPAQLVELAVVRQVRLRRDRDGAAAVERHGAVEEAAVDQRAARRPRRPGSTPRSPAPGGRARRARRAAAAPGRRGRRRSRPTARARGRRRSGRRPRGRRARERTWASALKAGSATRTSGTHTATRAKPCRRTSRKAGSTGPHHSGAPRSAQPAGSAEARRRAGDAVRDLRAPRRRW